MKKELTIAIAVAGLCLPATLAAQTAGAEHQAAAAEHHAVTTQHHAAGQERHAVIAQHHEAATQVSGRARVAGTVEAKITSGRPYTAEAVNETVQVLADGNRISRRSVTRVYRDTAGRTRREVLADDGTVRTVTISDPIAHTSYTLDPATKLARKGGGSIVAVQHAGSGTYTLISPTRHPPTAVASGGGSGRVQEAVSSSRRGGGRGTLTRTLKENPNVKKEEVGPQNIEGVDATGTRTTTTIPAGEIGNAQEIRIVSEQWFSDELQVLVLTKHSDPRSGETTYRLQNILRAESDPSLFMVPADYTIQERR